MACETMKIGYVRTSKKDQNPELQGRDLLAFGCERIFEEQISSRKADRPELRAAPEYVRGATSSSCGSSTASAGRCRS